MDNSFNTYLEQLELMAFFSGYPLIYALTLFIAGDTQKRNNFKTRAVALLPFAYALVGTLYLGFKLRNLYPDYSVEHIKLALQPPWLIIWGLLSILFWIPTVSKKKVLSLIHSLVFFFFFVKDFFLQLLFVTPVDKNIEGNDIKMYTTSLILNLAAFTLIALLSFLVTWSKKRLRS